MNARASMKLVSPCLDACSPYPSLVSRLPGTRRAGVVFNPRAIRRRPTAASMADLGVSARGDVACAIPVLMTFDSFGLENGRRRGSREKGDQRLSGLGIL